MEDNQKEGYDVSRESMAKVAYLWRFDEKIMKNTRAYDFGVGTEKDAVFTFDNFVDTRSGVWH